MILLKFLFLGNFLFISFNAFILIRYYLLSSKLFILSGLLFFKFLLRLLIFNIFLFLIFNLGVNSSNKPNNEVKQIVLINKNTSENEINDTQVDALINLVKNSNSNSFYSLSIFNPLKDSLGILIPQSNRNVFLNYIENVSFKKSRPIYYRKFAPSNFSSIKLKDHIILIKYQKDLIDWDISNDNFMPLGENWFSTNQISIYLLILLLFLSGIDATFKFKVLK
jgi:hypothetical protein